MARLLIWSLFAIIGTGASGVACAHPAPRTYNVRAFGAQGDGHTMDTRAVQAAIDAAGKHGGGVVRLDAGQTYLSGTLHMRSNVTLHIAAGATLLGSPHRMDYTRAANRLPIHDPDVTTTRPDYNRSGYLALIMAQDVRDIAVTGTGVIDGQGLTVAKDTRRLLAEDVLTDPKWAKTRPAEINRPLLLLVTHSRGVHVRGVTFRNAAAFVQRYDHSSHVLVNGIRVHSMAFWNNDGLQIVDSSHVRVVNSFINSADDGICLKSYDPRGVTSDVVIKNNTVRSSANAFKIGGNSYGTFRHIRVTGLRVYDTYRSAVALEMVNGGTLEDITVSGVDARNTGNALFIRLGNRNNKGPDKRPTGTLRHVTIRDLSAQIPFGPPDAGYPFAGPRVAAPHNLYPSSITGLPHHPVQDVTLKNIKISFAGGGAKWRARIPIDRPAAVPERAASYAEFSMFGELPAWGLYTRHVRGLTMHNVHLALQAPDYRHAMATDDVHALAIDGLNVKGPAAGKPSGVSVLALHDTTVKSLTHLDVPSGANAIRRLGKVAGLNSGR